MLFKPRTVIIPTHFNDLLKDKLELVGSVAKLTWFNNPIKKIYWEDLLNLDIPFLYIDDKERFSVYRIYTDNKKGYEILDIDISIDNNIKLLNILNNPNQIDQYYKCLALKELENL